MQEEGNEVICHRIPKHYVNPLFASKAGEEATLSASTRELDPSLQSENESLKSGALPHTF